MVYKTQRIFRRRVKTWPNDTSESIRHVERVRRDTWWLLGLVPIYSRETIIATNI
jgi:hypothetical protein